MTLLSFLIAFGHFSSEILIYRTANLASAVINPVIVSSAFPRLLRYVRTLTFHRVSHVPPLRSSHVSSALARLDDSTVRLLRPRVTRVDKLFEYGAVLYIKRPRLRDSHAPSMSLSLQATPLINRCSARAFVYGMFSSRDPESP